MSMAEFMQNKFHVRPKWSLRILASVASLNDVKDSRLISSGVGPKMNEIRPKIQNKIWKTRPANPYRGDGLGLDAPGHHLRRVRLPHGLGAGAQRPHGLHSRFELSVGWPWNQEQSITGLWFKNVIFVDFLLGLKFGSGIYGVKFREQKIRLCEVPPIWHFIKDLYLRIMIDS